MKNLALILGCLSLCFNNAYSQKAIKAGLSYAKFNKDGQIGGEFYLEYSKTLAKYISISPSFHVNYGTQGKEFPYYLINKFSTGFDFNLLITPVHFKRGIFKVGLGPSVRFISGRDRSYYGISNNYSGISGLGPNGDYWVPYFFPYDRIKPNYFTVGYSGLVESDFFLSNHITFGIRAAFQGYISKDKISTIGLNMGYQF